GYGRVEFCLRKLPPWKSQPGSDRRRRQGRQRKWGSWQGVLCDLPKGGRNARGAVNCKPQEPEILLGQPSEYKRPGGLRGYSVEPPPRPSETDPPWPSPLPWPLLRRLVRNSTRTQPQQSSRFLGTDESGHRGE